VSDFTATVTSLRDQGLTWMEVGRRLGYSGDYVGLLYREGREPARDTGHGRRPAPYGVIEPKRYPVRTLVGVLWTPPVPMPHSGSRYSDDVCAACPMEAICRERVAAGDFAGCECLHRRDLEPPDPEVTQ